MFLQDQYASCKCVKAVDKAWLNNCELIIIILDNKNILKTMIYFVSLEHLNVIELEKYTFFTMKIFFSLLLQLFACKQADVRCHILKTNVSFFK